MEMVRDLPVDDYDAIITMSGDGLIHEVLNGLSKNSNPLTALRTPIAPIPTGSGNGLSLNLLGLKVCRARLFPPQYVEQLLRKDAMYQQRH